MAGDGFVGGGGSVHWNVHADRVDESKTSSDHKGPSANGRHTHEGFDDDNDAVEFLLCVKVPPNVTPDDFMAAVRWQPGDGRTICCRIPVDRNDRKQIQIHWGNRPTEP